MPRIATLASAMARQRLGQHFLGDPSWQKRILATLPLGSDDVWVEVGPGHGEMTRLLAAPGRRLIAVEADARLAEALQQRVHSSPQEWPGVEVVTGDVLKTDLGQLAGGRFRVYGNLPYYITSPILHHLFGYAGRIASIHIVVQLEVAARIAASPGRREFGYLSAICQFYTRPDIVFRIPPGAFRPPPRVTSALLRMTLPGERAALGIPVPEEPRFLEFIQLCFSQKRKTLRNNLRAIAPDTRIHEALAAAGLRPDARAEQLSLAHFAALFAATI
jgi:16S rRNA (adenine1518-N6/adenine1519-N6)-dimethyltransferase